MCETRGLPFFGGTFANVGSQPNARETGQLSTFKNSQSIDLTLSAG
jgi:hypothetical protein